MTDPDPGRPDFGKHGVTDEKVEAKKNAGDQMKRQRELEKREEKRKMLATFVDENNVGVAEIQAAIEESAAMPADQRKKGIDFGQFCKFNKVEPTGEYHRLFQLFDPFGKGTVDMKELALGMLNFVDNLSKEDKCDLVFRIFDEDSSGLLTADELTNVLAANHMQSTEAVSKKAETIMRQADRDGNGELSLDEFRIVTQKCECVCLFASLFFCFEIIHVRLFQYTSPFFVTALFFSYFLLLLLCKMQSRIFSFPLSARKSKDSESHGRRTKLAVYRRGFFYILYGDASTSFGGDGPRPGGDSGDEHPDGAFLLFTFCHHKKAQNLRGIGDPRIRAHKI